MKQPPLPRISEAEWEILSLLWKKAPLTATQVFAALPGNADDLVRDHISEHAAPAVSLIDRPFMALALRQIREAREFDPAGLVPRCVNLLDAAERKG